MAGFLLGIDAGSSTIKVSLINTDSGAAIAASSYPDREMEIMSPKPGWAEQHPETWWTNLGKAIAKLKTKARRKIDDIEAIGISYQMHGLVVVDREFYCIKT